MVKYKNLVALCTVLAFTSFVACTDERDSMNSESLSITQSDTDLQSSADDMLTSEESSIQDASFEQEKNSDANESVDSGTVNQEPPLRQEVLPKAITLGENIFTLKANEVFSPLFYGVCGLTYTLTWDSEYAIVTRDNEALENGSSFVYNDLHLNLLTVKNTSDAPITLTMTVQTNAHIIQEGTSSFEVKTAHDTWTLLFEGKANATYSLSFLSDCLVAKNYDCDFCVPSNATITSFITDEYGYAVFCLVVAEFSERAVEYVTVLENA